MQKRESRAANKDLDAREQTFREIGVTEEQIRAWRAEMEGEDDQEQDAPCIVFPANADVLYLFLRVCTQWRISPGGSVMGLDHNCIWPVMAATGHAGDLELFDELRVMEAEAANELNRKHGA